MSIGDAAVYSVLGITTVFFALMLLMVMIKVLTAFTSKKDDARQEQTSEEHQQSVDAAYAPGSAGDIKLYDTDPRDAALVMAIVADKLGKPVNELRFISIREVRK